MKADWLWDCLRSSRRESFEAYLIHPDTQVKRNSKELANSAPRLGRSKGLDLRTNAGNDDHNKNISTSSKYNPRWQESEMEKRHDCVPLEITQADSAGSEVKKVDRAEDSLQKLKAISSETIIQLDESFDHDSFSVTMLQGSDSRVVALQEVSTNSPPNSHQNLDKLSKQLSPLEQEAQHDSLNTAISSLLAQHQRDTSRPPRVKVAETTRLGRRKRQLFGRAPSNLSACSNGSATLSRASSVDTMNTDGLGTPLDTTHPAAVRADSNDAMAASLLANFDEEETERTTEKLPLTQLGYEDPEAGAWRERLMNRMENRNPGNSGRITTRKAKSIGTVRDTTEAGLQSVSKRTRHAGGR